jgi:ribosome recycling factor
MSGDNEMIVVILSDAREKMHKAVEHTMTEFGGIRTGRASPAFVEKLAVDYYGSEVPLRQLAGFAVPEARLLVINPFDKASLGAIEKTIRNSDLGLNPSNDGVVIRLAFPQLTEERRRDLVKRVRHMAEQGKVAVRSARRDARKELDNLVREGDIGEDDVTRAEKDLDRMTHAQEADIDKALEQKEAELLEV